jgi:hypothetical protein
LGGIPVARLFVIMNARSPHRSQRRSPRRVLFRARGLVIIAGIFIVASIAARARFFVAATDPVTNVAPSQDRVAEEEGTAEDQSISEGADRKVYRHSVIPGGVYSAGELVFALNTDPVAKDHYKTVAFDRVQVKKLDAPRLAYVSYRVGDQLYWTKEKVALAAGESILTDGNVEIRARCGNAISTQPNTPTAQNEPPPPELDEVIDPPPTRPLDPGVAIAWLFPENPPFYDVYDPEPTDLAGGLPFFPASFLRGGGAGGSSSPPSVGLPPYAGDELFPLLPPPLPPVGNSHGAAGGNGDGNPSPGGDNPHNDGDGDPGGDGGDDGDEDFSPTGPPVAVPEPSTILLTAIGVMTGLGYRLRRRSRP